MAIRQASSNRQIPFRLSMSDEEEEAEEQDKSEYDAQYAKGEY
jgi:hypothetical protein